ncbi:FAD-dependent monooxygenase [Algicella marina]|uniref:UbiH/UbiF family hydroxylase n=1 Tax=Algicella marina TaxID=2683284 RepID=A0A6P1T1A5_9RHOB|nr:FAD-dependent monooxygenase [Algicella marina]QHQ35069.1 UbiH/UbiF family hydroxylase [Algicella marina]
MDFDTDIVVSGGGVAGLVATAAFVAAGFDVTCVEPSPLVVAEGDTGADLRSTAFLEPSIEVLRAAGLWARLEGFATDLRVMRLADAGGAENSIRQVQDFRAEEIGQERFGANLPNWLLRREMVAHLEHLAGARLERGVSVVRHTGRTAGAIVGLNDGRQVRARLVVAADGRNSQLREAAGIGVRRVSYGQKALVFAVSHPLPHEFVSTEIHRSGGPFTLVPLPDREGVPHSSVVWMEMNARAAELMALDSDAFEDALNARACGVLGHLRVATGVGAWPIISQKAERLFGPRLALIAEAAHVIPPIGAQGLNMSLKDIAVLRDLMVGAGDIGDRALLERYARARAGDIATRIAGVDALNRAAMAEAQGLRDLRNLGLRAMAEGPLKAAVMKAGLG